MLLIAKCANTSYTGRSNHFIIGFVLNVIVAGSWTELTLPRHNGFICQGIVVPNRGTDEAICVVCARAVTFLQNGDTTRMFREASEPVHHNGV